MKLAVVAILMMASLTAHAEKKEPLDNAQMFKALNIMAVPIGEKGMLLKDEKGCLWVIKNTKGTPILAAVLGEDSQEPLCEPPTADR